jgi:dihydrofolate reductase
MTRTVYYTATSLDGFIADERHSLDWLLSRHSDEHGPMGYAEFEKRVGALAMGATTYEWIRARITEGTEKWSYTMPAVVFTHRDLPRVDHADLRFVSGDVATVHAELVAAAAGKDVWVVGGGDLAGQFMDAGLLDEVWLTVTPVTLARGAPLLPRRRTTPMTLVSAVPAPNGTFVHLRYRLH